MANVTVRSNPCGPVMRTRNPPLNGSAAIQASCGPLACLPPATTAASIRSRRLLGIPLSEKIVSGIRDIVVDYSVGGLTLDTSKSRYAPALGSPSLGAHGAKSLSVAAEYGPGFTSKQTTWSVRTAMVCQTPG